KLNALGRRAVRLGGRVEYLADFLRLARRGVEPELVPLDPAAQIAEHVIPVIHAVAARIDALLPQLVGDVVALQRAAAAAEPRFAVRLVAAGFRDRIDLHAASLDFCSAADRGGLHFIDGEIVPVGG